MDAPTLIGIDVPKSVHRVRQGFVKARTAQANQIRGLLGEFGLIIPQGISHVAKRVPELLEDASNELPMACAEGSDGHGYTFPVTQQG